MREIPLSKCEYEFLIKCIREGKRLDKRDFQTTREVSISYKLDYGCCVATIGKTKILAHTSAEMDRPKESRPNEGNLGIFVEMSTMGSPSFDPTKPGELGVELQRLLERSIVFSKAVDLEELCVRVGEQAWNISLHIQILSHDGNILDCASVAAVAALSHFRRPDVTVIGKDIEIHSFEEKNPVPLVFNHQPFCVTFSFYDNGNILLNDPTKLEESCCDGKLILAVNKHREVCCTQMSGLIQIDSEQILRCVSIATKKAKVLTELVKDSIDNDKAAKNNNMKSSFTSSASVKIHKHDNDANVHVMSTETEIPLSIKQEEMDTEEATKETATNGKLSWVMKNAENTFTAGEDNIAKDKKDEQDIDDSDDEEEEATVTLQLS